MHTCTPLETIQPKPGLGPISCYIGSMDKEKLAEMLELALRELYVINTPDLGLEVGGQKRAAKALAEALSRVGECTTNKVLVYNASREG